MSAFGGMKIYTVHVKPGAGGSEKPVFVREGFNWMAFLFTGLWALYQRLWWPAFFIAVFNVALITAGRHHAVSSESVSIIQLGFQVLIGYLGNDWLRARLRHRGYVMADITAADSQLRAEQRYFERYLAASASH